MKLLIILIILLAVSVYGIWYSYHTVSLGYSAFWGMLFGFNFRSFLHQLVVIK